MFHVWFKLEPYMVISCGAVIIMILYSNDYRNICVRSMYMWVKDVFVNIYESNTEKILEIYKCILINKYINK